MLWIFLYNVQSCQMENQASPANSKFFLMEYQYYSLQSTIDIDMNMNISPRCEYDGIDEDDVFYAEITRQILLLTAEDDEDYQETEIINSVSAGASKSGSNRAVGDLSSSLQYGSYFSSWDSEKTNSLPTWLSNLWRSSNGTGVFIPRINKSRRHQRPGRMRKRKAYGLDGSKQS